MILTRDVISQGVRAGVHCLGQPKLVSRRILSAGLGGTTAQVCVLGGVVAAPILSVIGWVGLILPASSTLHYAASGLLASALIALGAALIGAHNSKDAPNVSHPRAE
jgi:hypothetical protein